MKLGLLNFKNYFILVFVFIHTLFGIGSSFLNFTDLAISNKVFLYFSYKLNSDNIISTVFIDNILRNKASQNYIPSVVSVTDVKEELKKISPIIDLKTKEILDPIHWRNIQFKNGISIAFAQIGSPNRVLERLEDLATIFSKIVFNNRFLGTFVFLVSSKGTTEYKEPPITPFFNLLLTDFINSIDNTFSQVYKLTLDTESNLKNNVHSLAAITYPNYESKKIEINEEISLEALSNIYMKFSRDLKKSKIYLSRDLICNWKKKLCSPITFLINESILFFNLTGLADTIYDSKSTVFKETFYLANYVLNYYSFWPLISRTGVIGFSIDDAYHFLYCSSHYDFLKNLNFLSLFSPFSLKIWAFLFSSFVITGIYLYLRLATQINFVKDIQNITFQLICVIFKQNVWSFGYILCLLSTIVVFISSFYESLIVTNTIAPLEDAQIDNLMDLLKTGRKLMVKKGDFQGISIYASQKTLNDIFFDIIEPEIERHSELTRENIHEFIKEEQDASLDKIDLKNLILLGKLTNIKDLIWRTHFHIPDIKCLMSPNPIRTVNLIQAYLIPRRNSLKLGGVIRKLSEAGLVQFQTRFMDYIQEVIKTNEIRRKKKYGKEINPMLEKNLIRPINMYSKIQLPFKLILYCILCICVPVWILELLFSNRMFIFGKFKEFVFVSFYYLFNKLLIFGFNKIKFCKKS